MEIVNNLWVEKYRPKVISDLVLPDEYMETFKKIIETQEMENFLFAGPPGGGKTSAARILTSDHGLLHNETDNLLMLNGSAQSTRGIKMVNDVIEPFLKIPPIKDKYKIVFIDECDYLTDEAVHSLRGVIEKYHRYGRFIFTCNYISKIPEAILSRVQTYIFKQVPVGYVLLYVKKILESEKVEYKDEDIKYVITNLYPDIRRTVNTIQKSSKSGKLKLDRESVLTNEKKIVDYVVEVVDGVNNKEPSKVGRSINNIMTIIQETDIEFRNIYHNLFFTKGIPAHVKVIINRYSMSHRDSLVVQMNFMAMIFEIIDILNKYNGMIKKS